MNANEIYILKEIHMTKPDAASNYGFCIKGGRKKALGIYVTDVVEQSLAQTAGLTKGDIIIRVNNTDFNTLNIDEAIEFLKASNKVDILLKRHLAANAYFVELNRENLNETFGFLVDNVQNNAIYLNRLFVKLVHKNSIAYYGKLKPGDEIIQINNKLIRECHYDEIYSMFKHSYKLKMLINSNGFIELNNIKLREEKLNKMINELSDNEEQKTKIENSSRKTSLLYDKIQKNKQSRLRDINDKSIKIEYLINSLDYDSESIDSSEINFNYETSDKERLFLPLTAEIVVHPQQILNIETELVIPESPVKQHVIQEYEYVNDETNKKSDSILRYGSHRSKIIPAFTAQSETNCDGLISIRLFKEIDWPKKFGLKLKQIADETKKEKKKFIIDGYESESVAEKLKLFQIGSQIKKVNENNLEMIDNIADAEFLLENVYTYNRQITLLVEPPINN